MPWPESDRIVLTGYPPMAMLEDGKAVCPDGHAGMDVLPDFALSEAKAREGGVVGERLNDVMRDSAPAVRLDLRRLAPHGFLGRGICASYSDAPWTHGRRAAPAAQGRRQLGAVQSVGVARLCPRQRWFRTPNDAFMTGNFHVSQSLLQNALKTQTFSWVQLLLASIYSGAFHPTAEGQAAIADAVSSRPATCWPSTRCAVARPAAISVSSSRAATLSAASPTSRGSVCLCAWPRLVGVQPANPCYGSRNPVTACDV